MNGRDALTVVTAERELVTFDVATGVEIGRIKKHVNNYTQGMQWVWESEFGRPQPAAVGGVLAVPTRWRVHLWDLGTSMPAGASLAGPVRRSILTSVRWDGRDWLVSGSAEDGVLAVWDLTVPVRREPGHEERIAHLGVAEPAGQVVSVDAGGTLVARRIGDGAPAAVPVGTGVEGILSFAVWDDGRRVLAAAGSGSHLVSHPWLHRWDVIAGEEIEPPVGLHVPWLRHLVVASVRGEPVLVTGARRLELRRASDGARIAAVEAPRRIVRMLSAEIDGAPVLVVSSFDGPPAMYRLDDLYAAPVRLPELGDNFIAAVDGPRLVTGRFGADRSGWRTVRARNLSGDRLGPDIDGPRITSVALAAWPAVYIARIDGSVTLTDLETGRDRCPPLRLPVAARSIAATDDGDLLAGFGTDVARFHPQLVDV